MGIGNKIKKARGDKRFTQSELASAIGVSDKTVSAYEKNRATPPIPILKKIANKTDHPVEFFLDNNIEPIILAKLQEIEKLFEEVKKMLSK